jgi:hypothetical protein
VGDLRFKAPRPLSSQAGVVTDVSDDALRCVQFGAPSNIVGVKAGPGVEVRTLSARRLKRKKMLIIICLTRIPGLPQVVGMETRFGQGRR